MIGFRIIFSFGLSCYPFLIFIPVIVFKSLRDGIKRYDGFVIFIVLMIAISSTIGLSIYFAQIYFFICINSLFHEIKEQNNMAQIPVENNLINQEQQGNINIDHSLPSYNEVMQTNGYSKIINPAFV